MSTRALRYCPAPGCEELVSSGRCARHQREKERARGSAAARGYDATHQRLRLIVLARDPVCRICHAAPSSEADHITPLSRGGRSELANYQGVCKSCNSAKQDRI